MQNLARLIGLQILIIILLHMNNHTITSYVSSSPHPILGPSKKYSFQFPKTQRFVSKNPECPEAFYTFDSHLSHRMTSMGFGKKSDFTKPKAESPPPSLYLMKSGFEEKKKGRTFGCSREKSPDRSYLIPQIHKNPGPGQYDRCRDTFMHQKSQRAKTILLAQQTNRYTQDLAQEENPYAVNPKSRLPAVTQSGNHAIPRYNAKMGRAISKDQGKPQANPELRATINH